MIDIPAAYQKVFDQIYEDLKKNPSNWEQLIVEHEHIYEMRLKQLSTILDTGIEHYLVIEPMHPDNRYMRHALQKKDAINVASYQDMQGKLDQMFVKNCRAFQEYLEQKILSHESPPL